LMAINQIPHNHKYTVSNVKYSNISFRAQI
jgi:hypothetical protein